MSTQSLNSRFHPGFIPLLIFFTCLLLLICIGPGSTQGLAAQVTLAWDANTDPAVAGYKLYYGKASRTYGTPVDVGKVTQYTLTGIQEGVKAYFAVTAYDANRKESAFSTELECFTLVPAACVNGSISPSSAVVDSRGMNQTFTITPAANYKVSAVTVDGASVGAVTSYTFSNVTANHTISAAFIANTTPYTISASAGTNGSISPSGSVSVTKGASQTFAITPAANYKVSAVTVDGASVGAVTSYTFSNVTANHTISAAFIANTTPYTISASAGTNGSISPSGSVSVTKGASQTFSIKANTGYKVQGVLVDGTSVGAVTSYTFSSVTAAHTISATFAPINQSESLRSFNGDSKPDILWRNTSTGQIYVLYLDGVTPIGGDYLPTVADPNWEIVGVGDFNGDGASDILWRNTSSGHNCVWYMNGVTFVGRDSLPTVADLNWTIVGVGDFNGDGASDILWRNTSSGQNCVWYMNGVTRIGTVYLPTVADLNWKIVGVGDFNGDGAPDILLRNTSNGQNCVWYLNGVASIDVDSLPTVADQNRTIVGVDDFNGDGAPDILWRNISSGQNYVWYMNGVTRIGTDSLPTVADLNWRIY